MKLQQFMDVSQSDDLPTFYQRLLGFAHDLDFGLANATVVVDRPGSESVFMSVNNIPPEFAEATDLALSKRDPVLQRLKRQSIPFAYDQTSYVMEGAADMWEIQAAHGYRTGLAVALHMSNRRHFLLGLDRETALPKKDEDITALLANLQLLTVHAQDAALRLLGVEPAAEDMHRQTEREKMLLWTEGHQTRAAPTSLSMHSPEPARYVLGANAKQVPQLNPQEIECLKWRGEGKSAWETGKILSLSESRINKVCAAAAKKLGCSTTSQAALRALRRGLFD